MAEAHPEDDWRRTQTHLFLSLPPEMREHIWTSLDSKDVRVMRQVCALFKFDMEQILGLKVVIKHDPLPQLFHHRHRCNTDPELLQMRTQWLQGVIVRRLELEYVGELMNYAEITLKNSFMLRALVLKVKWEEFGNPVKVENLERVLNSCTRLSSLQIQVGMEPSSTTANFGAILSKTLACLEEKVLLKDFKFSLSQYYEIGGEGYRIMPDPEYISNHQFPMQLNAISLEIPLPTRGHHLDWQAFLNTQARLRKVDLKIGLVSWHFFEGALRNSSSTLRDLSVHMSAPTVLVYKDEDLRVRMGPYLSTVYHGLEWNENDDSDEDENLTEHPVSFDWSMLSQTGLESLTVRSPQLGLSSISMALLSHNFTTVHLSELVKLHLSGVHLGIDDLTWLFIQGTKLTSVYIGIWNLTAEREDGDFCLMQNLKIWILVAIALQGRPFTEFIMEDDSLAVSPILRLIVSAVNRTVHPHNRLVHYGASIGKLQFI